MASNAFAHHENEDPDVTAAHVESLKAELAGQEQRANTPKAGEVHVEAAERRIPAIIAELERFGVKRTRLAGDSR